ncbi:MAG: ScbR family autoregulator-binding transcription factor [Actinomycetes bacterium]
MAKQARSELTREAIVLGAAEAFDRFGYASASLNDVIAQAGVTKGALYFHFSSKEELARAVIEAQHARSVSAGKQMIEQKAPGLESIIRLSQEMVRQLLEEPMVRAGIRLTLENGTFHSPVPDPYREWMQTIELLLRRAIVEKDVREMPAPEDLARFIVAAFTGVQLVSQVLTSRADLRRRIWEMWELLLPALVPARKLPYFRNVASSLLGTVPESGR